MSSPKYKFILSGGGTGGHIFPALSIANELKHQFPDAEFLFVGAKDRMEMQKVPEAGYNIEGLWISGIQRQQMWKNFSFPFKLVSSIWKCKRIIKKFQPDAVIGTGGFASGPLMHVAQKSGIPTIIQEQNSYPGITNKLLSKGAQAICVAYEKLERFFPKERIVHTGNPIRKEIIDGFSDIKEEKKNHIQLLILGGSLGAMSINNAMKDIYTDILDAGIHINWQCGKLYYAQLKTGIHSHENLQLNAFLTDMTKAYQDADIIVSRAGAGTISELCMVGKPAILIPSPNVAEDHQTKNAQAIANNDAAILLKETDIDQLKAHIISLAQNNDQRSQLSQALSKLAKPHATKEIIEQIKKVLK